MRLDVPVEMPAPKVRKTDIWERPEFFRGAHSSGKKFNEQIKNLSIYQQAYLQNKDKDKWSVSILDAAINYANKADRPVETKYNNLFRDRALETNAPFDYILNNERLMKLITTSKGVTVIGNGTARLPNTTLDLFLNESAKDKFPLNVFVLVATPQKFENAKTVFAQGSSGKGSTIQPTILQPKITINTLTRDNKTGVSADSKEVDPKASEGDDEDTVVLPLGDPSRLKSPAKPTETAERGKISALLEGMPPSEPYFEKSRTELELEGEIQILKDQVMALEENLAQTITNITGYQNVLAEAERAGEEEDEEMIKALNENLTQRRGILLALELAKQKLSSLKAKLDVQKIRYNRRDEPSRNLKLESVIDYVRTELQERLLRKIEERKIMEEQMNKLRPLLASYKGQRKKRAQARLEKFLQDFTRLLKEEMALKKEAEAEAAALKAVEEAKALKAAALKAQEEEDAAKAPPPIEPKTGDATAPADEAPRPTPSIVPRGVDPNPDPDGEGDDLDDSTTADASLARVPTPSTPVSQTAQEMLQGSAGKREKTRELQEGRIPAPMTQLIEEGEDEEEGEDGARRATRFIELPQKEVLEKLQAQSAPSLKTIGIEEFNLSDPMQTPSLIAKLFKVLKDTSKGAPTKRGIARDFLDNLYSAKLFAEKREGSTLATDAIMDQLKKNTRLDAATYKLYESELGARIQPLYTGKGFMVGSGFSENMDSIVSASLIAEDAPNQQYLYVVHIR